MMEIKEGDRVLARFKRTPYPERMTVVPGALVKTLATVLGPMFYFQPDDRRYPRVWLTCDQCWPETLRSIADVPVTYRELAQIQTVARLRGLDGDFDAFEEKAKGLTDTRFQDWYTRDFHRLLLPHLDSLLAWYHQG